MTALRKPTFRYVTRPIITFDEEMEGHEDPLRQFFRLALLELQNSLVMEGRPGRLLLTYDLSALNDRKYYDAGVLIGWSLAHGGPGLHCLHPTLYQLMCGQHPPLEDFSWRDIPDADAQVRLQELQSCSSVKMMSASLCEWVADCGLSGIYSAHSLDLPSVKAHVVKHCIYERVASMISQFTEGLNSCGGLWDLVRAHWEAFLPVMTHTTAAHLGDLQGSVHCPVEQPGVYPENCRGNHHHSLGGCPHYGPCLAELSDLLARAVHVPQGSGNIPMEACSPDTW
ncbi:G2/M phase-specific E3 ubiquitin-protein ligase-like [Aplochiton taeniatus]